jgi:hypothetical protein
MSTKSRVIYFDRGLERRAGAERLTNFNQWSVVHSDNPLYVHLLHFYGRYSYKRDDRPARQSNVISYFS